MDYGRVSLSIVPLHTEKFDLVIVSAFLSQEEQDSLISAAGQTPTLLLDGSTFTTELLAEVERLLSESKTRANLTPNASV
jgi:hypothetical protein